MVSSFAICFICLNNYLEMVIEHIRIVASLLYIDDTVP